MLGTVYSESAEAKFSMSSEVDPYPIQIAEADTLRVLIISIVGAGPRDTWPAPRPRHG
jgi:hypothetical protein